MAWPGPVDFSEVSLSLNIQAPESIDVHQERSHWSKINIKDLTIYKGNTMIISFLINAALVAICVIIHFEVLNLLTLITPRPLITRRVSILLGVFGTLSAHLLEVWIFGLGYFLMAKSGALGRLEGNTSDAFMDCVYFSLTCYTSLGFGDISPSGWIRFLAGMEALTGLVLIAWTASFMFLEMQKHWHIK